MYIQNLHGTRTTTDFLLGKIIPSPIAKKGRVVEYVVHEQKIIQDVFPCQGILEQEPKKIAPKGDSLTSAYMVLHSMLFRQKILHGVLEMNNSFLE
jgi:hypothetical protein